MKFKMLLASAATLTALAAPAFALGPINLAFAGPEDARVDGEYVFAEAFRDSLAAHDVEVIINPNDTMGNEDERLDQVSTGLVEVNLGSPAALFKMSPIAPALYLPFMFESEQQMDEIVAESGLLNEVNAQTANYGVMIPGFNMRGGLVGIFTTDIPVTKMSDLDGVRLRAQNGEQIKFFESWGARGTVVSFAEVPNALQTGVAQGYFNPPSSAIKARHTDILKNYAPLDAMPVARVIMVSQDWYDSLSAEEQGWVNAALDDGIAANREWSAGYGAEMINQLGDMGVTVTTLEPGEREKFATATKAVWAETADPAVIEELQSFLK
ncbi:TRAP transporter substrate-binding protein [Salipiger sp. H15]|uniref:TRAP transporter substrate-binding protein n=1 Tax=Alloyangia sp. H15 TaxID=3029062 RepID=A0AAU8AKB0_9RHOB